jgi:hypothetical protein
MATEVRTGKRPAFLPMGVSDPLFMAELALEMGMPIGELGERMSNYELNVVWPAYRAHRAAEQAAAQEKANQQKGGRRF